MRRRIAHLIVAATMLVAVFGVLGGGSAQALDSCRPVLGGVVCVAKSPGYAHAGYITKANKTTGVILSCYRYGGKSYYAIGYAANGGNFHWYYPTTGAGCLF